jgi:FemAB-related protein (PEP-CTERM system-associated)
VSSAVRAIRVDPADPRWDAYVRDQTDSTFCHLSGWAGIIRNVLGREYHAYAAVDDAGEWCGVLPMVRVKAPLLGHSLISVPYLNYGGPLGTPSARACLVATAVEEASRSGADRLQLRCRNTVLSDLTVLDHKVLVLLDLPDDPDTLWNAFPSKLRSQIRKPEKAGMRLEFGKAQGEAFYEVFSRNMRDLGTPVYHRGFFDAISGTFDEAVIGTVYYGDTPVAAGFGFLWQNEFEMTWASSNREYNALAPNMLLYWGFMRHIIGRGARVFNFGRSSPDAGTHRFKKQWGGADVALPWVEWRRDEPVDDQAGTSSPSAVFRMASKAWQRLPVSVANRIGPPLAARLPWW